LLPKLFNGITLNVFKLFSFSYVLSNGVLSVVTLMSCLMGVVHLTGGPVNHWSLSREGGCPLIGSSCPTRGTPGVLGLGVACHFACMVLGVCIARGTWVQLIREVSKLSTILERYKIAKKCVQGKTRHK